MTHSDNLASIIILQVVHVLVRKVGGPAQNSEPVTEGGTDRLPSRKLYPVRRKYEHFGVWLRRESMDIAGRGHGLGPGLGGASEPRSDEKLRSLTVISCVSPATAPPGSGTSVDALDDAEAESNKAPPRMLPP